MNAERTTASNVDPAEVQKFDALASRWWDPQGEFKPLHQLNPVRLDYIVEQAVTLTGKTCAELWAAFDKSKENLSPIDFEFEPAQA